MIEALNVAMIDHPNGGRDDRISEQLAERGHNLIWFRPADGDPFPDVSDIDACVSFGGSGSANDNEPYMLATLRWTENFVGEGKPFFGVCLGAQILAKAMGAAVYGCELERGFTKIHPSNSDDAQLAQPTTFYQWHKETFDLPHSASLFGYGDVVQNQAFKIAENQIAVQFHPDVRHRTCARWLTEQRSLWPQDKVDLMEAHLPLFAKFDVDVDAWVSNVLDPWDMSNLPLGRHSGFSDLSPSGLERR